MRSDGALRHRVSADPAQLVISAVVVGVSRDGCVVYRALGNVRDVPAPARTLRVASFHYKTGMKIQGHHESTHSKHFERLTCTFIRTDCC